ncbi:MAG TPA: hypothetical protein VII23_06555 [Terriglobales bacterium]
MSFQLEWVSLQQVKPFKPDGAQLLIQFRVLGLKPDFVQVYAVNYGETTPSGLADLKDAVPMDSPGPIYTSVIGVEAAAFYTIWLCPRSGEKDSPDDQIDEQYWESFCVGQTIVTQSVELPPNQRQAPMITAIDAEPATLTQPDRITVRWSSQPYDKFLIWWTQNGEGNAQGEVNSSSSWIASPTVPGARYTFAVKGGTYGGVLGNYLYSDWGPTVKAKAPFHYSSLRQYLRASGINPGAQGLRSLMHQHHQPSVRRFMKLS